MAAGGLATFVDMATESAGTCAAAGSCCPAGIHPTVVGYDAMAEVWSEALLPVVSAKRVANAPIKADDDSDVWPAAPQPTPWYDPR